ncbi:MAG: hypothetical protein B5766_06915 [Candidatus Lumbricidophila eiseniae]|uniref:DUF3043 domain-containing protein n=1 Tax=Candidatus Lumbricidiphila eiseniae TaxID=1969409 RepID=A0A2A6FRW5_9MICO|nr:MAG: hypothetical protein B5766_06915 [Candidatus Lumbricidophila eiseniae]
MVKKNSSTGTNPVEAETSVGKGTPTPSRAEREAARKRPLVPHDRKAAAKEARAKIAEARERQRVGMAAGDERYLPARDRGPHKRYVRDYVDARFSIGEFLLPTMFVFLIVSLFSKTLGDYIILGLWLFLLIALIDAFVLGLVVRKKLAAKYGAERVDRVRWYAAMRAIQLRAIRLPKPQVKRGAFPQ